MLSGSTDLVRYTGRRSGRLITTPTQYARLGQELIVLVGRPESKTWWRNFRTDQEVEVLVEGRWLPMTARAVVGADEPDTIAPLLAAYRQRFPRSGRSSRAAEAGSDRDPERDPAAGSVIVWCRPR